MNCRKCNSKANNVINSRSFDTFVRRRRECLKCSYRWTTIEINLTPKLAKKIRKSRRDKVAIFYRTTIPEPLNDIIG